MIVNLEKFIAEERPRWTRLDELLRKRAADPWATLSLDEARELERLYQRASADLARLATFSAAPEARQYLEALVGRGFAEVHGGVAERQRFHPGRWLVRTLPQTFRRRIGAFWFCLAVTLAGAAFGALALALDPDAKAVLIGFGHLQGDPSERVAKDEAQGSSGNIRGHEGSFAGMLMVHNTKVALTSMALGLTWGIGTLIIIFYNGVMLGAVAIDYVLAGETTFLFGWLLPHGAVEIPALLVGGQAGFVLAGALIGRGQRARLADRLRNVGPDVVTLGGGAGVMLVWAGIVESFLSQYHEPVIPYAAKIGFGLVESLLFWWWLARCGRSSENEIPNTPPPRKGAA